MILTCPNCGTQYAVKDGAIPPEGRQVRCAACKHSWHQDPEIAEAPEPEPDLQPGPAAAEFEHAGEAAATETEGPRAEDEGLAEATFIDPRSGPEAEERAYEEAVIDGEADPSSAPDASEPDPRDAEPIAQAATAGAAADWKEPPTAEAEAAPDMFSPFAEDGEVEPRRRGGLGTIIFIVLAIVVAAALFWFLAPAELKAKLGIAQGGATPLQLVTEHMDRTPLESGNDLLTVTGRVINPSPKEQDVPPIQAQLKDHGGKVVKSWTIQPPAHSLAAGASASFNSAEVNVPPGADELTITLGEPRA
jgi:predicted Zn finger-like uncharacterized protein